MSTSKLPVLADRPLPDSYLGSLFLKKLKYREKMYDLKDILSIEEDLLEQVHHILQ